jgi:hypothetical protein
VYACADLASDRLKAIRLTYLPFPPTQAVVCECNHLTDFSTLEETLDYMGVTLHSYEEARGMTCTLHTSDGQGPPYGAPQT